MTHLKKQAFCSLLTIGSFLCPQVLFAGEDCAKTHTVAPGDVLSKIALDYLGKPVWGDKGSIAQVAKCNEQIKDVHMIYPKDVVSIPTSSTSKQTMDTSYMAMQIIELQKQVIDLQKQIIDLKTDGKQVKSLDCQPSQSQPDDIMQVRKPDKDREKFVDLSKHRFSGAFGVYQNVLDAQDRGSGFHAQWVSKTNLSLEGVYQFNAFEKLWLGLRAGVDFRDYENQTNPNFTWNQDKETLLRVSLISDFEFKRFGIGVDVDYADEQVIYEAANVVSLEKDALYGPSLRLKFKWLDGDRWSSRLHAKGMYHLGGISDIDTKGDLGYIGSLDIARSRVIKNTGVICQVYYGHKNLTNNQNDQSQELAGVSCGLRSRNWF